MLAISQSLPPSFFKDIENSTARKKYATSQQGIYSSIILEHSKLTSSKVPEVKTYEKSLFGMKKNITLPN